MFRCLEIANDAIVKIGRHAGDVANQPRLRSFEARNISICSQRIACLVANICGDIIGNVDVAG
jgi:hypothetical protein